MTLRVAILGGYGNFGGYIARALASDPVIELVVCGRDGAKASSFASELRAANPARGAVDDIAEPDAALAAIAPDLVIHAVGPFQGQDYTVARAAITCGAHYCDLADARSFVAGIGELDEEARQAGVFAIAGASSVPCLTAAYLDRAAETMTIEDVDYGISAAQQTNRGLGTAAAILSYVGKPFTMLRDGAMRRVWGWQGIHSHAYPEIGRRWFGYCDIPDLDLFPQRYPELRSMRFAAGHEIAPLHWGTWLLSWGVRSGILPGLERWAGTLLRASFLFDPLGSDRSGFHLFVRGRDSVGRAVERRHWLIARQGHGPNIPCMPAILIARKLAAGEDIAPGARPCLDLITLDEYLAALEGLDITAIDE
ncbi:saccharopine dehydrogenase NADP-binding domain-containing protein [Qipengyuania sp. JC766]|uniref:saccharopine dehydrogenase family protein n=1 Tax=Qipengyuania sp. JC766 TaxID=3232139 RepID=UPI0034587E26